MRTSDTVGAVIGALLAVYNIKRLINVYSETSGSLLEIFSINVSICVVAFFLNPDIMVFNSQFLNGDSFYNSYQKSIVESDYYFPESPMLFFLFVVSLLFSTISIVAYIYVTRKQGKQQSQQSSSSPAISTPPPQLPSKKISLTMNK